MLKFNTPKFPKTFGFFTKAKNHDVRSVLDDFGRRGVAALSAATPVDSGETASSWSYKIKGNRDRYKLVWTNSVLAGQAPLVLLIQYGHGTRGGGWYVGKDFINPALKSVYADIAEALHREVTG